MNRLEANLEILRLLENYLKTNPDIRLGQALRNIGVVQDRLNPETGVNEWLNGFYEEPQVTLCRVQERLK